MRHVTEIGSLPVFPVGPLGSQAYIFDGAMRQLSGVSLMLGELQPGEGPALHRRPHDEAFVIAEGRASFTIDGVVVEVGPAEVVVIPAGVPHAFATVGEGVLRVTAIHASPKVEIEWLEPFWKPDGAESAGETPGSRWAP